MDFTKLRLSGFKSFIEPTELNIEAGITGVVGPNGCGKSNVVEALRWVMGETSPKQVRGGGMDDMIFNGTDSRAPRNVAEVSLMLDNSARDAPAAFNGSNAIEVARRIERGGGSIYSINGQEVRARDVQLLFADIATGAHSSALVGQGRINDLINAKPTQRRGLLEEAAGITGLHARRHEAELRLRAAEGNLERLQDVIGAMETQLQGLKRQSRQASRYRRVAENLRRSEALLLHLRWANAQAAIEESTTQLEATNARVGEQTRHVAAASTAQAESAARLPELRQAEAERAAALHRLAVARDRLEEEERQVVQQRADLEQRLEQISADLTREEALLADARAALERIDQTRGSLVSAAAEQKESESKAADDAARAQASVAAVEDRLTRLTEEVAAHEARQANMQRRLDDCAARLTRLGEQKQDVEQERTSLATRTGENRALEEAEHAVKAERRETEAAREALREAERAREAAEQDEAAAREALQAADAHAARLSAEKEAITELLYRGGPTMGPAIIDSVHVEPGYEAALGVALGEDIEASENESAAIHWAALDPLMSAPPLPEGAEPLSRFVRGPRALESRLMQIGVVDAAQGPALRAHLSPGQRLVSREGAMWRWDGFTVGAEAATPAANRLKQRNRLEVLERDLPGAEAAKAETEQRSNAASQRRRAANAAADAARSALEAADERLSGARDRHAALATEAAADVSRLRTLAETAERLDTELAEAERERAEARAAVQDAHTLEEGRAEIQRLREELARQRAEHEECARRYERIAREAAERDRRLAELTQEGQTWRQRADGAQARLAELNARRESTHAAREALEQKPAELAQKRSTLLDDIARTDEERGRAADALAAAEEELGQRDRALKQAEQALAAAREDRVRNEGALEQAKQSAQAVAQQVRERLGCAPEETLALAEVKEGEALPEIEAVEARIERLTRERDNIGPVNLRAEAEAAELEEQIGTMLEERADLEAAIARLRQGVSSLNREGRERLMAAFSEIDQHFRELFTHLFGGGHAHLTMVESDDPLEAGLEIMASPPGKRLQALSLLSGGEKALTALALLFAAFLTNPAPICVLDEVDAPLDDSNVDRFCTLISDIVQKTKTRFVVVTHHRMTMARVDRLFGVTMAERGVSQIVSVDLTEAEQWRESA